MENKTEFTEYVSPILPLLWEKSLCLETFKRFF